MLKQSISLFIFSLCITNYAEAAVKFSPYADVTINTHWDSQYQDMEPMDLVAVSKASGIHDYHLAFITDAGTCVPAWGGQESYSVSSKWGSHLTDAMRANNIAYTIAFGGATGNDLSKGCSEQQLVSVINNVIATYQPAGLDFDIENGTADVPKLMRALYSVQTNHKNLSLSFTLAVLPEGLTHEGEAIIKTANENHLNYHVNIMAMDYGPAYTNDMGQYAIQAATNVKEFLQSLYTEKSENELWQMVEVTPMIGVNDVSIEQFTLTNVNTLRQFANQVKLGGLSMWSVARDNPCRDKWASPICSGNNLQIASYDFARRFNQ